MLFVCASQLPPPDHAHDKNVPCLKRHVITFLEAQLLVTMIHGVFPGQIKANNVSIRLIKFFLIAVDGGDPHFMIARSLSPSRDHIGLHRTPRAQSLLSW